MEIKVEHGADNYTGDGIINDMDFIPSGGSDDASEIVWKRDPENMDEETQVYEIDDESLDEEVVLLSRNFVQTMFNAWMDANALDLLKRSYERKPALKRSNNVVKK